MLRLVKDTERGIEGFGHWGRSFVCRSGTKDGGIKISAVIKKKCENDKITYTGRPVFGSIPNIYNFLRVAPGGRKNPKVDPTMVFLKSSRSAPS